MATNIYTLNLNWNSGGQFCSTVMHYVFEDGGFPTTAGAAKALIDKWDAISRASWLNMLPTAVTLLSAKGRKATGVGGFEAVKLYSSGNTGARSGGMSATGLSPVLIHFPIDRRAGRGKTFLPGLSESDASAGVFLDSYRTAIATNIPTAFSDLTLVGGGAPVATFVVKTRSGSPGYWVAQVSILSDLLGQQRRRQRPS
jgi:hypothetical protein